MERVMTEGYPCEADSLSANGAPKRFHIAFIVESAHGHINPTLGTASRLVEGGFRVTYAVSKYFASRVRATGGEPKIYSPLETKTLLFRNMIRDQEKSGGEFAFDFDRMDVAGWNESFRMETEDTCNQLKVLYGNDRPDLIIYDLMNPAGKMLASEWDVPTVEHSPMIIESGVEYNDEMVIVSLPRFFQKNADELGDHFHFVGPIFNEGRFFEPWDTQSDSRKIVLVSSTTGLLPQVDFFRTAALAFEGLPWRVILSLGDSISPECLRPLPDNVEINQVSSQPSILQHACLFVGQGGPSSIFEALRFGVPLLLLPPSQVHDVNAKRVEELGLGYRVLRPSSDAENLRRAAIALLDDESVRSRVKEVQSQFARIDGAKEAANLVAKYIRFKALV